MSGGLLKLLELLLIVGAVLGWAFYELYALRKYRAADEAEKAAKAAKDEKAAKAEQARRGAGSDHDPIAATDRSDKVARETAGSTAARHPERQ